MRCAAARSKRLRAARLALAGCALLLVALGMGCHRNVEAYDPDEKVEQPDLAKIFPEGAEAAADASPPIMPPADAPGSGRGAPAFAGGGGPAGPVTGDAMRGTVLLAPELTGKVPPQAVLFLIARTGAGGPPTAVKRIASPVFPLDFELGPDDRMIQSLPWTGPFQIQARVDADGNATTREAGDLASTPTGPHAPGAAGIEVKLDELL